jgi:hypothetical protein
LIELVDKNFLQSRNSVSALRAKVTSIVKMAIRDYRNSHEQDDPEMSDDSSESESDRKDNESDELVHRSSLAISGCRVVKGYQMDITEYDQIKKKLPNHLVDSKS